MTVHQVFANRSNVGDWLSAVGIRMGLGLPTEEHLCDGPFVQDTLAALTGLGADDHVVVGGGGLLMDYFDHFWHGFLDAVGPTPFSVWGIGLVDLKREPSRPRLDVVADVLARATVCAVRDRLTRDAVGLEAVAVASCPSVLAVAPRPPRGPVDVLLHSVNLTTVGEDVYEEMVDLLGQQAEQHGLEYRQVNNRIESGSMTELEAVLAAYARARVVVSSRLHGCIIAVALGRPVVAVSGDHKIEAFMEAAGLADWTLGQADVAALPETIASAEHQPDTGGFMRNARASNAALGSRIRRAVELCTP